MHNQNCEYNIIIILCYVMCYTILCHAILYCILNTVYCTISYYIKLYYTELNYTILYYTILYYTVPYNATSHNITFVGGAHSRSGGPGLRESFLGYSGMWCFKLLVLKPSPIPASCVKSPHPQTPHS